MLEIWYLPSPSLNSFNLISKFSLQTYPMSFAILWNWFSLETDLDWPGDGHQVKCLLTFVLLEQFFVCYGFTHCVLNDVTGLSPPTALCGFLVQALNDLIRGNYDACEVLCHTPAAGLRPRSKQQRPVLNYSSTGTAFTFKGTSKNLTLPST
jgi:hypothetical protein